MFKFNETRFKDWIRDKISNSVYHYYNKNYNHYDRNEVDQKIDDQMDSLSPMELVCLLGEYLTLEKE